MPKNKKSFEEESDISDSQNHSKNRKKPKKTPNHVSDSEEEDYSSESTENDEENGISEESEEETTEEEETDEEETDEEETEEEEIDEDIDELRSKYSSIKSTTKNGSLNGLDNGQTHSVENHLVSEWPVLKKRLDRLFRDLHQGEIKKKELIEKQKILQKTQHYLQEVEQKISNMIDDDTKNGNSSDFLSVRGLSQRTTYHYTKEQNDIIEELFYKATPTFNDLLSLLIDKKVKNKKDFDQFIQEEKHKNFMKGIYEILPSEIEQKIKEHKSSKIAKGDVTKIIQTLTDDTLQDLFEYYDIDLIENDKLKKKFEKKLYYLVDYIWRMKMNNLSFSFKRDKDTFQPTIKKGGDNQKDLTIIRFPGISIIDHSKTSNDKNDEHPSTLVSVPRIRLSR